MKATEDELDLYIRGLVMARGNYTFEDLNSWSAEQLYFIYHYQELQIRQQQEFFSSSMGIMWDKNQMIAMAANSEGDSTGKKPDKVFVPLSAAINPQIIDFVRGLFGLGGKSSDGPSGESNNYIAGGDYIPKANEKIVSMSKLSKRDFLALLGRRPAEDMMDE